MPRPVNYITKLRRWAKSTNGDEGIKWALLNTISLYNKGEASLLELNKQVAMYSKTIVKEEVIQFNDNDSELEDFLSVDEIVQ